MGLIKWEKGSRSQEPRKPKVILKGELVYSFGKNGQGLSDELLKIGNLINMLSNENRIYLTESFVDSLDDVYDLKFDITPKDENEWVFRHNFTTGKRKDLLEVDEDDEEPLDREYDASQDEDPGCVPYNPAEYNPVEDPNIGAANKKIN